MTILTRLCYVCLRPILMLESQLFLWIADLYCIIWDLHLSFYCNKMFEQKQLKRERICFSSLSRSPVLHGREVKAKEPKVAVLITFKTRKLRNECIGHSLCIQSKNPVKERCHKIDVSLYLNAIKIILQKPIT